MSTDGKLLKDPQSSAIEPDGVQAGRAGASNQSRRSGNRSAWS